MYIRISGVHATCSVCARSVACLLVVGDCRRGKIAKKDSLFQGLGWRASCGKPGVVGPLFVSRTIFVVFFIKPAKHTVSTKSDYTHLC